MPRRAYPSDLSDAEWARVAPLLPPPRRRGRPEAHDRREVLNAMLYVLREGCTWRALPHDFPPWQTVYRTFRRWFGDGTLDRLNTVLRTTVRVAAGRTADPHVASLDSQTVRTTEKGGHAAGMAASASGDARGICGSIGSVCCWVCSSPQPR